MSENQNLSDDQEHPEDITITSERAQSIRAQVSRLREAGWMESLRAIAGELGTDWVETDEGESLPLPGFSTKGEVPKVFCAPQGHASEGLRVALQNTDLKVFFKDALLLELSFLPKDGDYVVYFLDESRLEELNGYVASLDEIMKAARAAKTKRQAEWSARFKK
ncbi:MAG: hypothetical protein ABIR96_03300 [Bdellovibrionota bacterium]